MSDAEGFSFLRGLRPLWGNLDKVMSAFPVFSENHLDKIAKTLGDMVNGSELTILFNQCGIDDLSQGNGTKWRRVYDSLLNRQRQDGCGNNVAAFIKAVLTPSRFIDRNQDFEHGRRNLNAIILFDGLELDPQGNFHRVTAAQTIPEAETRARILSGKLKGRHVHPEVLRFCRTELLQDNYFHAVFEATKSLAQRVRDFTGLKTDGASLIDEAFSINKPFLAFNSLRSESEKSEQIGFTMLIKGCFSAVRNPLAHEPKIMWDGEDDAADYLTLISLLHRKLDDVVKLRR